MDATTLSQATKFHCLRRGIPMPPDILAAARLIPVVQKDIARHLQHEAANSTPQSGDYIEWKNILEDLQDFLADLQKLAAPPGPIDPIEPSETLRGQPTTTSPATPNAPPLPRWERAGVRGSEQADASILGAATPHEIHGPANPTEPLRGDQCTNSPKTHNAPPLPRWERAGVRGTEQPNVPTTKKAPTTQEEHAAWIAAAKARCASRAVQNKNKNENTAPNTPASERGLQPQSDTGERAGERPPSEGRATPERDPIDPRATTIEEMDRHPIFGMLTRARSEDKIKQARAEYLAELQRERASRSPIDNLSPERQQMLFEMLEENTATAVVEMIAEPEPLGWNFKIHVSSLKRFRERYKLQLAKAERLRVVAESTQTVEQFGPGHKKAVDAANNLVKLRFFDAARDAQTSTRDLHVLSRILDRQRRTDLAERKQTLAETK